MASGDLSVVAAHAVGFYSASGIYAKGTGDTINIPEGYINIGGNGHGYVIDAVSNFNPLTAGNNDETFSSFSVGQNYFCYACQQATGIAKIIFSLNSTYPDGYTADNSRKVGWFHYGRVRTINDDNVPINTSEEPYGSGWKTNVSNGIVPNAVCCLLNRPSSGNTGLAKVGKQWVYIYLASQLVAPSVSNYKLIAGSAKSAYNATPLSGTEGLSGSNFNELSTRTDERLLTLDEWYKAAEGSPQGEDGNNTYAWAATTNTGRTATGTVAYAISAYNIVDCVGNLWEWLATYSNRSDSTSWAWVNPEPGGEVGQLYLPYQYGIVQYIAGGDWNNGLRGGSRCVILSNSPWDVGASSGCRFACGSQKSVI